MSDTAAFIAGCAVTGVAAVLLARGDLASSQLRPSPASQPAQTVMGTMSPMATDDPSRSLQLESQLRQQQENQTFVEQLRQQQVLAEDFKSQLAKQQTENETLKSQLDKQQSSTEQLVAQLQEQQRFMDRVTTQEQFRNSFDLSNQSNNGWQTAIFAVGAVVLILVIGGGGILLVMMVMMWMNNQGGRRKQTRTVHVVHPMPTPPYGLAHPQAVLPARSSARSRQPRHIDVDYYSD